MKSREPMYWSLSRTAKYFGMAPTCLSRFGHQHELYKPAVEKVPTGNAASKIGEKTTRFHVEQVKIIERVLLGVTDLETAWLEWQVRRNRIAGIT